LLLLLVSIAPQVNALQSANATLSEALVLAREELSGKPGGSMEQQLAAVSMVLLFFSSASSWRCCSLHTAAGPATLQQCQHSDHHEIRSVIALLRTVPVGSRCAARVWQHACAHAMARS
jgi:hypothetical protein